MVSIALPIVYTFPWYCLGELDLSNILIDGEWLAAPLPGHRCHHYASFLYTWVGGVGLLVCGLGSFFYSWAKTKILEMRLIVFEEFQLQSYTGTLKNLVENAFPSNYTTQRQRNRILSVLMHLKLDMEHLSFMALNHPKYFMKDLLKELKPIEAVQLYVLIRKENDTSTTKSKVYYIILYRLIGFELYQVSPIMIVHYC